MTRLAGKLVLLVYLVELLTNVSVKILFPALVKPSGAARKMELWLELKILIAKHKFIILFLFFGKWPDKVSTMSN